MQSTSYLRSTRKRLSIVYQYKQALMKVEQVHKEKQSNKDLYPISSTPTIMVCLVRKARIDVDYRK